MDRRKFDRRAVELAKDVLILFLTCSAVWLLIQTRMLEPLHNILREDMPQTQMGQTEGGSRIEAVRPLRIAVNLTAGMETGRYGVQYDQGAADALFQQVAGLLAEGLSSAGQPERVNRYQWEEALTSCPGVYFDFQGDIPLQVLVGWLSGEESALDAHVRRLVLSLWQNQVAFYYQDQRDGYYYRCLTEVVTPQQLESALTGMGTNGARFAFETDLYQDLDPDTLLTEGGLDPVIYQAANPAVGGQSALAALAEDLDFSVGSSVFYSAGTEQVVRNGNDTLRLTERGIATYLADRGGVGHFPLSGADLFEAVETCRRLAADAMTPCMGEARLYLMSVQEVDGGWQIDFGYCLNGVPVQLDEGSAAQFLVQNGRIDRFTLRLRSYTASGARGSVMPPLQATAALTAKGMEGDELMLAYLDGGGDSVSATWVAAGSRED